MTEFDVTSWADQAAGEMQERTEPTTAAGRAMFADFGHPNFVEKWNAAILAIEAEARAAALDDETLGDALHSTYHPAHPWSGCYNPEIVYGVWLPRFRAAIDTLREEKP